MVNPFQLLAQGVVGLGNHFSNILDYINPFSENFILKNIISGIGSILTYINPFSENFILKNTDNFLGNIFDRINPFSDNFILKDVIKFLGNLVSYVNPFSDNFLGKKLIELFSDLFKALFIPSNNQFEELKNRFNEKFGFISQVKELVSDLFTTSKTRSSNAPNWDITWNGVTFSIIDFSVFDEYRGILHGIIIAIMYVSFFLRLYKRLPGIIGAYTEL